VAIRNGLTPIWSLLHRRHGSNRVHILEKSAFASQTVVVLSTTKKIYEDSFAFNALSTTKLSLTPTLSDTLFDKPGTLAQLLIIYMPLCLR
jgi:hypothetical protein